MSPFLFPDGNLRFSIDTMNRVTANTYDGYGRSASTTVAVDGLYNAASPLDPGSGTATTSDLYYPDAKVKSVTTPAGVTAYTYDDFGNPATTRQPNGAVTTTLYDGFGEEVQVTDPDNNVTQYRYDGAGKIDPEPGLLDWRDDRNPAPVDVYLRRLRRRDHVDRPGRPRDRLHVRFRGPEAGRPVG